MTQFIAAAQHGNSLRQHQSGKQILPLFQSQPIDFRVVCIAFSAAVPAVVVVVSVAIVFKVRKVSFFLKRNKVFQAEPIVRRHEINAGLRSATVMFIQIAAAGQSCGELVDCTVVARPESADCVAIFAIPF